MVVVMTTAKTTFEVEEGFRRSIRTRENGTRKETPIT
jgi:hypothetical protein